MCGGVLVCGGGQGLDFRESYRICTVVVALAIFLRFFFLFLSPQASPPCVTVDDIFLFFSFFPFSLSIMVLGERWSVAVVGSGWVFFLVALLKEGVILEQLKLKDVQVFFSPLGTVGEFAFWLILRDTVPVVRIREGKRREGKGEKEKRGE